MLNKKVKPLPLIAIVGPTASGKTDLALKLAKKFNGVVISADSRQIYQYARLGTNQPPGKWKKFANNMQAYFVQNVPHFFIDFLLPNQKYSVVKFQNSVSKLLKKIPNNYLAILVGGTGLYISAIVQGYIFPNSKAEIKLRKKLENLSLNKLLNKLKTLDRETYNVIDKNNKRRLVRALEHVILTGQPFSSSQKQKTRPNTIILGINPDKKTLRQRIAKRTASMIKLGLIKEAQYLKKYYPHSTLLKTIGYKEILQTRGDKSELLKAKNFINTHTWQYSRRQITWFKKMPNVIWINNRVSAQKIIDNFLKINKKTPQSD